MSEHGRERRVQTRFETLYASGRIEGAGVLADISYSGALIQTDGRVPEIGSALRLYVFLQPVAPFEIEGTVVRHCDGGFAIEHKVTDPEICRLVDDVAAIVG